MIENLDLCEPGYKRKVFHIKIKCTHNHNTRDRWGCGGWLVEGKVLGMVGI